MVRCGDPAPDDTYIMLPCSHCGGVFPHTGPGRRPKMCPWAREQERLEVEERKAARKAAAKDANLTEVPVFEKVTDMEPGDIVYRMSDILGNEVTRRKYSYEYKVKEVTDNTVTVVSTKKAGYRNYPHTLPLAASAFYKKSGSEYLDITEEREEDDE